MAGQHSAPPTIVKTWQLNRWEARICVSLREKLRHKLSRYLFDLAHQWLLVYLQCVMEIKGKYNAGFLLNWVTLVLLHSFQSKITNWADAMKAISVAQPFLSDSKPGQNDPVVQGDLQNASVCSTISTTHVINQLFKHSYGRKVSILPGHCCFFQELSLAHRFFFTISILSQMLWLLPRKWLTDAGFHQVMDMGI